MLKLFRYCKVNDEKALVNLVTNNTIEMNTHLLKWLLCFVLLLNGQFVMANHSMHPLKQIAFVKKMIERQQEPYHTAYVQLIRYADSIQHVTHHARNDFAVPGYYVKPEEHRANSLALQQDAFAAYCSALAYRL